MIDATAPDGTRLHLSAHSVSGYKGVFESAGRYQAQVRVGGKQKYIGIFPTKMEAAIAVARANSASYVVFAALGKAGGTAFLLMVWALGAVILGIATLLTRPRSVG
jgi:hypothetical protein